MMTLEEFRQARDAFARQHYREQIVQIDAQLVELRNAYARLQIETGSRVGKATDLRAKHQLAEAEEALANMRGEAFRLNGERARLLDLLGDHD